MVAISLISIVRKTFLHGDLSALSKLDLAQGYLQMAMEKADIPKTAFHAGSSGLYKFTHMPFGLTNAELGFCCREAEPCINVYGHVSLYM